MHTWLKWILLTLGGVLLLAFTSLAIFILSKSRERISFVNLNPAYKLTVNQDLLKQVMAIDPKGAATTWSPDGDKFAARKVWVIIEPGPTSVYDTGIKRSESPDFAYTYRWLEKGDYDFLLVRTNHANLNLWTPHVQSQMLNWITLKGIVAKYPTGGLSDTDITFRLGKIYLDDTAFPVEIHSRL